MAGDEGHGLEVREGIVPWMMTKLYNLSPAVYGSTDPHIHVGGTVILPVVVVRLGHGAIRAIRRATVVIITRGAGQQPECAQRRRHLPLEQEAVGKLGQLRGERTVAGFATDAEVDAGRRGPEVAPSAREHAGAGYLPRPQERHDFVQQLVREGAEVAAAAAGRLPLDGFHLGFLPGHSVEHAACKWNLGGRGNICYDWKFFGEVAAEKHEEGRGSDLQNDSSKLRQV